MPATDPQFARVTCYADILGLKVSVSRVALHRPARCRWLEDVRFRIAKEPSGSMLRVTVREAQRGIGRGGREVGHAVLDTSIITRQLDKLRAEQENSGTAFSTLLWHGLVLFRSTRLCAAYAPATSPGQCS
jgi:hypothetical protein